MGRSTVNWELNRCYSRMVEKEVDPEEMLYEEYRSGCYSPSLLTVNDLEPDTLVYDPQEDMQRLEFARRHVLHTGQAKVAHHAHVLLFRHCLLA